MSSIANVKTPGLRDLIDQIKAGGTVITAGYRLDELSSAQAQALAELRRELADERELHRVSLEYLSKLEGWGWGENAPDLAKQEWHEARAWLAKMKPDLPKTWWRAAK